MKNGAARNDSLSTLPNIFRWAIVSGTSMKKNSTTADVVMRIRKTGKPSASRPIGQQDHHPGHQPATLEVSLVRIAG